MGMVAVTSRRWSVEEFHALPETPGQVVELLDGELLVSPAPRFAHQRALRELTVQLHPYLRLHGLGELLFAPAEMSPDRWTAVQPDLSVFPLVDGRPMAEGEQRIPRLIVEVLSPSTSRIDRGHKRTLYQRLGIEYWIVDLDAQLVEQWMPDAVSPVICHPVVEWAPSDAPDPFRLILPTFFAEVIPSGA